MTHTQFKSLRGNLVSFALVIAFVFGTQFATNHTASASPISFAADSGKHDIKQDRKAIRARKRQIHNLRKDVRTDKTDAAKDVKSGQLKDAKGDIKDIQKDRRQIRADQKRIQARRKDIKQDKQ